MSTALALLVVWSIVAMALWCCYRLWYCAPTDAAPAAVDERPACEERPRAA
jgi:hypothetical protein